MSRGKAARTKRRIKRAGSRGAALGVSKAQDQAPETLVAAAPDEDAETATTMTVALKNGRIVREPLAAKPNADGDDDGDGDPNMGRCANCSHMASAHAGEGNDGACSMNGCSCNGYETASAETASTLPVDWVYVGDVHPSEFKNGFVIIDTTVNTETNTFTLTFDDQAPTLPDEHQPGASMPRRRATPGAPASTIPTVGPLAWTATLCPEGKATDDGRIFAPGSISWRELPLSLMAMTKTADGHDGAEVAGRIDRIWREGGMIRADGVFDSGEFGSEIARLVTDGTLRGVSVDIAPQKVEIAYRGQVVDDDGYWKEPEEGAEPSEGEGPSLVDLLLGNPEDDVIYVVKEAVLGMATVCPFQAFADAKIETQASLVAAASPMVWTVTSQAGWVVVEKLDALAVSAGPGEPGAAEVTDPSVLTASAAGLAPEHPPADWFSDPELTELTPLTVDNEGRISGHAAPWGLCHIGLPGGCTTAPESATNYAYFHLKEVVTDDGERVPCGTITLDTGHADKNYGRADATRHYDDTGVAVADVVVGEDDFGIWVAGALRADVDADEARKVRGAALSGDWRAVNGNLELVALLAVNVPGFPVPRPTAALVASGDGWEPTALLAAGVHAALPLLTDEQRQEFELIGREVARQQWEEIARLAGKAA